MPKATIGSTVHYVNADEHDNAQAPCLPAIVTGYHDADTELFVINHDDTFTALASHGYRTPAGLTPRTWHSASPTVCDGGFRKEGT